MSLEKRNELIERFDKYELQKGGKTKPRNISAVVADPGIPELHGMPQSITNLMLKESRGISKDLTSIVKGHSLSFYILNKEVKNHLFEVVINFSERIYKCKSRKCYCFTSFSVCQHTLAVLDKLNLLHSFLEKIQCVKSDVVISKLANVGKETSAGSEKRKVTEKRKSPPNTKHILLKSLVHHQSPNEEPGQNIEKTEQHNSTANLVYTVLTYQNMIPVSTTSNLTPPPPNPSRNCHHLTLLKFCHRNISKCYGCQILFVTDGYPKEPYDFVLVSKTQRSYVDPKTRPKAISSDFSNVYFHFHGSCVLKHDSCFTPQSVIVPEELKRHLLIFRKNFLDSLRIFY